MSEPNLKDMLSHIDNEKHKLSNYKKEIPFEVADLLYAKYGKEITDFIETSIVNSSLTGNNHITLYSCDLDDELNLYYKIDNCVSDILNSKCIILDSEFVSQISCISYDLFIDKILIDFKNGGYYVPKKEQKIISWNKKDYIIESKIVPIISFFVIALFVIALIAFIMLPIFSVLKL